MALTLFVAVALQGPTADYSRNTANASNSLHTMTDLTAEQEDLIRSSLATYERAGLRLPGIHFTGYDDREQCRGRQGMARRSGRTTKVWICTRETGPVEKWMVLHELAHTWDYEVLTPERREALIELRNLNGWRLGEWNERGSEQSAEIIVWGIIGREAKMVRFDNTSCHELTAAFVTLTGNQPDQVCG